MIRLLILQILIDCVRFDRMCLDLDDPLLLAQLVRVTALLLLHFSLKEAAKKLVCRGWRGVNVFDNCIAVNFDRNFCNAGSKHCLSDDQNCSYEYPPV